MKKGISPLIATVLIIGFVVAIGAVVMLWGRGFVKERTEKEGALSEAKLNCNSIDLKVVDTSQDEVTIENRGSVSIGGFKIKFYDGSTDVKELYIEVKPMGRAVIRSEGATKMDIIPAIKPEGVGAPLVPCSDEHKLVEIA